VNNEFTLISGSFLQAGAAAARTEARIIFSTLESNPTLADNAPLFGESNTITGALSDTNLDAAIGRIALQETASGDYHGFGAAVLAVSSADYGLALRLNKNMDSPLKVIQSPYVSAGHWYVFADPAAAPVIGRLTLVGSNPLRIEQNDGRTSDGNFFDGVVFAFGHDVGYAIINRVGVIRGMVSED
jgi:hypothetical protein